MKCAIVADAGPLIGLARAELLPLLPALGSPVVIPPQVLAELLPRDSSPGASELRAALRAGWLRVISPLDTVSRVSLTPLDPGEEAALLLATQLGRQSRFLLLDERRGRAVAARHGVRVLGTAGLLLTAKSMRVLPEVLPAMDRLRAAGYYISLELRLKLAELAGEG